MKRERLKYTLKTALVILMVILLGSVLVNPGSRFERKYPERQEVIFWHMWTSTWKEVVDRIVERFNESQDEYEVIALSVPGSGADTKFLLSVVGGDPPDVMAQWNSVIPVWATRGVITPLDSFMTEEELAEFKESVFPVIWKIGAYEGHFYGLCVGLNVRAMYYRPSHFIEAGLDPARPPQTIEELDAMAVKLDRFDTQGNILRIGHNPGQGTHAMLGWVASFGGGFYDYENQSVSINTPRNLKALQWIRSYSERLGPEKVIRFTSSLQSEFSGDWSFINGAYSIVIDGQWRVEQLAKYAPELDYETAFIPMASEGGRPKAGFSNGNFMLIPKGAKCPEGAWKFMRFWSGLDHPEVAAEFYTWGGWLPIKQEIVDTPIFQQYLEQYPKFKTFVDTLSSPNLMIPPPVTYQNYLMDRLVQMEQRVVRMSVNPEQGLLELEREIEVERMKMERNLP